MSLNTQDLEVVACALCGGNRVATVLEAGPQGRVVRCLDCSLLYVSPRPRATANLYEDEAYFSSDGAFGYPDYLEQRAISAHYFERLAARIAHICPRGSMLEVGAAAGFFLEAARAAGLQVAGIEPSASMARYGREELGLAISPGLLGEVALPAGSYDAVALLQTFEHLPDPAASLRDLRTLLRPGGLLLMSMPNVDSWLSRLTGSRWFEYKPPEHLYYFSPKTIARMLRTAGFSSVEVHRDVHWYTPEFVLGRLERYYGPLARVSRLARAVIPAGLRERSLPVYYGSMLVTATRVAGGQ